MRALLLLLALNAPPAAVPDAHPDCAGPHNFAAAWAYIHLKNEELTGPQQLDFAKTRVVRVASEKIGKDLYRQVNHIWFTQKSGEVLEVITVNDASHSECSEGGVEVYLVGRRCK